MNMRQNFFSSMKIFSFFWKIKYKAKQLTRIVKPTLIQKCLNLSENFLNFTSKNNFHQQLLYRKRVCSLKSLIRILLNLLCLTTMFVVLPQPQKKIETKSTLLQQYFILSTQYRESIEVYLLFFSRFSEQFWFMALRKKDKVKKFNENFSPNKNCDFSTRTFSISKVFNQFVYTNSKFPNIKLLLLFRKINLLGRKIKLICINEN